MATCIGSRLQRSESASDQVAWRSLSASQANQLELPRWRQGPAGCSSVDADQCGPVGRVVSQPLSGVTTIAENHAVKWKAELAGVLFIAAVSSGCVSTPETVSVPVEPLAPETTVYFYPTQGQSAEQQDRDKYECYRWAVQQSGFDPSLPGAPPHLRVVVAAGPPPGAGVVTGAVVGGALGAAVSRPWEAASGALVGAIAGAAIGGIAESQAREQANAQMAASASAARDASLERKASDYRRAMGACLEGRGYNVR
jgi:hypothetical protein